jgi:hypothetical protein
MVRKVLLAALLAAAVSIPAFAGEGSDTVGGGKLLPQLRYGYGVSTWETNDWTFTSPDISSHRYYAQVNWGILDNVELVALAGGESFTMEDSQTVVFLPGVIVFSAGEKTEWADSFMWGLGARGTFWRSESGLYVGGGALFTHTRATDYSAAIWESIEIVPFPPIFLEVDTGDIFRTDIYQLTADLHAGWHIGDTGLTPYAGVDYTWARMHTEIALPGGNEFDYEPKHPWGIYAGADYFLNDRLYLNVEARSDFADGWGLETGVGYMFDLCAKPAPAPAPTPVIEPKLEPMSYK